MQKNMSKFNEEFMKNCNEDSDKGYVFEVDVGYPKKIHDLLDDSSKRMKIEKCNKLVCNLYDKKIILST